VLTVRPEKVCYIILKAREFGAKVALVEPDPGSNPTDDDERAILEDYEDDPTAEELSEALADLNEEELLDVLTLMVLGRDDMRTAEWESARQSAEEALDERAADTLMRTPLMPDHVEDGLSELGLSCADYALGRL